MKKGELKKKKEKEQRIKTHELIRTVAASLTLVIQVIILAHLYGVF